MEESALEALVCRERRLHGSDRHQGCLRYDGRIAEDRPPADLEGVEWPTASTLLHFCDRRPYPILDFRALWSLGYSKAPRYTMEFWLAYLNFTRQLARRLELDIGTLDRALWQYSKERQRGS